MGGRPVVVVPVRGLVQDVLLGQGPWLHLPVHGDGAEAGLDGLAGGVDDVLVLGVVVLVLVGGDGGVQDLAGGAQDL